MRSFQDTSTLASFGHKTKPSFIKHLNISLIKLHSVRVKPKGNKGGNKIVSSK